MYDEGPFRKRGRGANVEKPITSASQAALDSHIRVGIAAAIWAVYKLFRDCRLLVSFSQVVLTAIESGPSGQAEIARF